MSEKVQKNKNKSFKTPVIVIFFLNPNKVINRKMELSTSEQQQKQVVRLVEVWLTNLYFVLFVMVLKPGSLLLATVA